MLLWSPGWTLPDFLTRICRISFMFLSWSDWVGLPKLIMLYDNPRAERGSLISASVDRRRWATALCGSCVNVVCFSSVTYGADKGKWLWTRGFNGPCRGLSRRLGMGNGTLGKSPRKRSGIESIEPSFSVIVMGALEARRWTFEAGNTLLL